MLRRFLLVGVGGSGGKTLRLLRRELEQRLEEVKWTGTFPLGWQFLHIDVPVVPDGNEPTLPPQLPDGSYVGLVPKGLTYSSLDRVLVPPGASSMLLEECAGWRPDPVDVKVDVSSGAGQLRTLGRVIALANARKIRESLDDAVQRLAQPETITELDRVSAMFGNKTTNQPAEPVAIVVSSIAGGSGAGVFLDICDILKATNATWCANSMAVLFTPDVFEDIPDVGRVGVHPNALASVSELLAGYWNAEPIGETEYAAYQPAGIIMSQVKQRGPRYPYLIGRSNQKVTFGGQIDVYRGAGSALAALMTSAAAQDSLVAYRFAQWSTSATTIVDHTGLKGELEETPFSSFGFATVGLGRDRFARYASERIARLAVDHLLRAHWEGRKIHDEVSPEEALEEARRPAYEWFREASGLDELGEDHNDIIDGLRDPQQKATIEQASSDVLTKVRTGRESLKATEWAAALTEVFQTREPDVLSRLRLGNEQRAREWVLEIQHRLRDLVATTVAQLGAPVTVALLDTLAGEMAKVVEELSNEAEQLRRWATKRDAAISSELNAFGDKAMPAGSEFLLRATDKARQTIVWAAEAELRGLTIEIVRDLNENLLAPLRQAVSNGVAVLARQDNPPPGTQQVSEVRSWPEADLVPPAFIPAVNERLVEPTTRYPESFDEQMKKTVGQRTPLESRRLAVSQVILGGDPENAQQVIVQLGEWLPQPLASAIAVPSRARFEAKIDATDVLDRARDWVHRPNTSIGDHVHETLRRYLDPDKTEPAQHHERLDRFRAAFTEALDLSAPLVEINNAVLRRAHERESAPTTHSFTEIPFPAGTAARQVVESVLQSRDIDPTEARIIKSFGSGDQARIDILSFLEIPLQPVVFDSLVRPIASHWTTGVASPEARRAFWRWRRSRPLTRFVPMGPEVRRAFIRGWFVARLLGQLDWPSDLEGPVTVKDPSSGRVMRFPFPLLTARELANADDLLPAVLESLPLAMLEYNTAGNEGDDALRVYRVVTLFGEKARKHLNRWIEDGQVEGDGSKPNAKNAGTASDDASQRRKTVVEYFESRRRKYAKISEVEVDATNMFDLRPAWELRSDLRMAFNELIRIAEAGVDEAEEGSD
jgi:hypothetical protein